jgi:hemoglobin-like flavoprotein
MLTSAQKRTLALKAIIFFRQYLFKRNKRLDGLITVNLRFQKIGDAWGICDHHDIGIKPREFTILINSELKEVKDIITTVAHEMVHVWQYATGKLRDYEAPVHRYENDLYDADMSYRDMPWEIEARQLEKVLYKLWLKQ